MPDFSHLCGTFVDLRETAAVCNALAASGCDPVAANRTLANGAPLKGTWERKGRPAVFLTDADDDIAWSQASGTCCGQGWGHALQTSMRYAIKFGTRLGQPSLKIAWEPLYILGRTVVGRNTLGRGDGACVPWLAQAGYLIGVLARGKYGQYDLSNPQEAWAVQLSQPRQPALPKVILDAMAPYKLRAGMQVTDLDTGADCLAAGYALVRGGDRATGQQRDADGITGTVPSGGHCEHIPIVFIDRKGDRIWGERNSWRDADGNPRGNGTFKLSDGSERTVPDGVGGLRDEDVQYYIDHGDLWTAEPPLQLPGYADTNPSDYVKGVA